MKTFYSLIKIAPNALSGDSLTIGLLLRSTKGFRYSFSRNKKNIAKSLLADNSGTIDFIEKQIIVKLEEINSQLSGSNALLFNIPDVLNSEYFQYLHKYSNGILQFSSPSMIADDIDDDKFHKLYTMFVDSQERSEIKSFSVDDNLFQSRIYEKLIVRVEEKVHTKQKFDNNLIPSLISAFEMDCVGMNGSLIGAKSLPLTLSKPTLNNYTSSYINVIVHLSVRYHKDILKNKFYVISDEPAMISSPEHIIWERLLNEKLFSVVSSEEVNKVAELIEETNASKFLEIQG